MIDTSKLVADSDFVYNGNGFSHRLASGIATLDIALGGGIPLDGSVIEIWGEESHGKTTLSYRLCKRCTDIGGYVTWVDSEQSFDRGWAMVQGVNPEAVITYRPPYMEKANEIILEDIRMYKSTYLPWLVDPKWRPTSEVADKCGIGVSKIEEIKSWMIENAPPHMIVWDSLAAAPVKTQVEGEDFAMGMAYRARLIKAFLSRYMVAVNGCEKLSMILINQVIDNIGEMYGPAVSTPGGRGLRHSKHLSLYMKKAGSGEKDADQFTLTDYVVIGVTKNKVTPVISSFPVIFSKSRGFLGATSVLEYLRRVKYFRDAGSWKKFNYEKVDPETGEITVEEISFQMSNFYKLIVEQRPELFKYLCEEILKSFIEKFPNNAALQSTDIDTIVKVCLNESTAVPDEDEEKSLNS